MGGLEGPGRGADGSPGDAGAARVDLFDPDTWRRASPILDQLLEVAPEARPELAERLCGDDPALHEAILRLAAGADLDGGPLDHPAAEIAANLLTAPRDDESIVPADLPPGAEVGGYRILGFVGRGGMGAVYRALHPTLDREVALKVLTGRHTASSEARRRLIDEARAVSRIDHPNVQTVYDAGETEDGRVFVAFALYAGGTLSDRLAASGALTPETVAALGAQVARGLDAAHRRGIVHRDIKPSNLAVLDGEAVKILDFGVSSQSDDSVAPAGSTYGTLAYMSPEQTRGEAADGRADVWSTGVVLYEMLVGRRPFVDDGDRALIRAIRDKDPPPIASVRPDTPAALADLIGRCLAKDPADRPGDMASLADALEAVAGAGGRPAAHPSTATRTTTAAGGPPWAHLAAAGALVAVVTAAAYGMLDGPDGRSDDGSGSAALGTPAAESMAILPFVPMPEDTALRMLGRELAMTLSTSLNGIGAIRTTEGLAVLASAEADGDPAGGGGAELARRFATASYLEGTLRGVEGDRVHVDLVLRATRTGEDLARASAAGPAHDLYALTDSATLAVLRAVWGSGPVPAPSLAALTTRSVPALRAYLDGELMLATGRYDGAVAAYDSAFRADSTFWLALWRSVYPRTYEGVAPLDSARYRVLYDHRASLPEADRMLIESSRARTGRDQLAALRDIVQRYPGYRPGWWAYANFLVHEGGVLGVPLDQTRSALERTIELDPAFFPAWEHLFWIAAMQRDRGRAETALTRMVAEGDDRRMVGLLPMYRTIQLGIGRPLAASDVHEMVDPIVGHRGSLRSFFALGLLLFGEPEAQYELSRAVLAADPPPEVARWHRVGMSYSLATRGDWDGAVRSAVAAGGDPDGMGPFTAYGLAAVAAWLGEMPPARAAAVRPAEVSLDDGSGADLRAEIAWLDGLVAFAARSDSALEAAHDRAAGGGGTFAGFVAQALAAHRRALRGDSATAGRALARLEESGADQMVRRGALHPWLTPVNRLAAGRWLAAAGDTTRALSLLGWEETVLPERSGGLWPSGMALSPLASLVRARLYAARGDSAQARFHFDTVLDRRDLGVSGSLPGGHGPGN